MLPSHLRVFISSVMADAYLAEERGIVREAIESLELTTPWTFESSSARPAPPGGVTRQAVGESDMLVLIVANRHTPPVQAELDEARRLEKPILAFVERLGDTEASAERHEVVKWLSERVTYKEFEGRENLEQEVLRAIRTELIEGYRKRYEGRLTQADIPKLVPLEPYPGLIVRMAEEKDATGIEDALMELKQWYPDIGEWITKRMTEIGSNENIRVAQVGGDIGAVAILRDKGSNVRKFATLYVRPTAQGGAIGPHLVRQEVIRAAKARVRKAYVTCADEIMDRLMPILGQSGFVPEGVSRGRYRGGSAEWVLGKTFVYDNIAQSDFVEFVKSRIIIEAGGEILDDQGDIFEARIPRYSVTGSEGNTTWYAVSTIPEPEKDYARHRVEFGERPWMMVSTAGRPADISHSLHEAETWIDGADIHRLFYPVVLETMNDSLIVTIRPQFANALIPSSKTPSMLDPTRLQIRTDNVYYRTPDRYDTLRRGSRLFFYVSEPDQAIRGSAIITAIHIGNPESCFERYGNKGIYDYAELEKIAENHNGQVLAISFDWYEEFEIPINRSQLQNFISNYNPQNAYVLHDDQARQILRMASRGGI